ncbi:hypothetical protein ABMB68_008562 [Bradyrhizobium sp. RT4a]
MNVHKNAPLTPKALVRGVVEGGLNQANAADQFNTTPKTVAKRVKRFRAEGVDGLRDRSSRPHSSPSQTPPATCAAMPRLTSWRSILGRDTSLEFNRYSNSFLGSSWLSSTVSPRGSIQ